MPRSVIFGKQLYDFNVDFAVPAGHRIKLKEYEKNNKYLDLAWVLKNYGTWMRQLYELWLVLLVQKIRITKGTGGLGISRTSGDHSNNNIIENGQTTKKSPGDLRRLAVTQTPVKNHRLTLMWKTPMEIIIIIILSDISMVVKQNQPNRNEQLSSEKENATLPNKEQPSNPKETLSQEQKIDLENVKRTMNSEKTTLPSLILFTNPSARAGYDTRSIF